MKVSILGIGSVRCSLPVIATLAGYFGERPLDLHFWDSDPERPDLFDRFARLCFQMTRSKHSLQSGEESDEALANADAIVLAVGPNCASRFLRGRGSLLGHGETNSVLVRRCVSDLLENAPLDANILSLVDFLPDGRPWTEAQWPPEPAEQARKAVPHQVLRFLNGEDYPHRLLETFQRTPLSDWLDKIMDTP